MRQHLTLRTLKQFFGYGAVGLLNTAINFSLINLAIVLTGISNGPWFIVISFCTFCIVVLHSFLWNRNVIFARANPAKLHREYAAFFGISGASTLISLFLLNLLVNVIGPQWGLGAHAWANVALVLLIPFSVVFNFLGYKLFVFKEAVV